MYTLIAYYGKKYNMPIDQLQKIFILISQPWKRVSCMLLVVPTLSKTSHQNCRLLETWSLFLFPRYVTETDFTSRGLSKIKCFLYGPHDLYKPPSPSKSSGSRVTFGILCLGGYKLRIVKIRFGFCGLSLILVVLSKQPRSSSFS